MTSQTAREALIEELAEAIRKTLPDFPYSTRISAAVTTLSIIARIEAEALARGRMEGAKAMQEAAAEWLHTANDQAAEDLGNSLFEINRKQRAVNIFIAQPYFEVIAEAILALDPPQS